MNENDQDGEECIVPPPLTIEAISHLVLSQAPHEARDITEYVEGQCRGEEEVVHTELIKTEFVSMSRYDVWDVHTDKGRWWVITSPTNLYSQSSFPSLDYTLSFHIGLMARVAARNRPQLGQEEADMTVVFRKMEQISDTLEEAEEVEDYQTVGLQCREVLVALSRAISATTVIENGERPKAADFKHWAEAAADTLAPGSSASVTRGFLKDLARRGWDLVSWLTHSGNATHYDAIVALMATNACVDGFAMVLKKHRSGSPDRCPNCSSNKITSLYRPEFETNTGYIRFCPKCEWTDIPDREASVG
ncbi:MAG: hypothetical protein V4595_08095 [Pseudomonadota bacterium]